MPRGRIDTKSLGSWAQVPSVSSTFAVEKSFLLWISNEEILLFCCLLGVTYHASDRQSNFDVALKMEKQDKARKILKSEYEFLCKLHGYEGIIQVHDFVD